ncbi:BON domain-containing protein, partial [Frankia sp. CiP1_Cm_nod2]|uniref:BON domain-containing protein n=1 Tax=Frankia sp. CiP1_Cm_nod2 TaxID=2897161 RepID=UPI002024135B
MRYAGRALAAPAGAVTGVATGLLARPRRISRGISRRIGRGIGLVRERAARRLRYLRGWLRGLRYRLAGGRPDPRVADDILADRVRSRLGPVTRGLDVPRVHVTVRDHVVILHGDVATAADTIAVEEAVWRTSGVEGVVSMLHEGLVRGDTRPSEGVLVPVRSVMLRRLFDAAQRAGCEPRTVQPAVHAVLATFFERLPAAERRHVASHLPADVRALTVPPRRRGRALARLR